jgi:hypothetical protein
VERRGISIKHSGLEQKPAHCGLPGADLPRFILAAVYRHNRTVMFGIEWSLTGPCLELTKLDTMI